MVVVWRGLGDCAAAAEVIDQGAAGAVDPGFDGAQGHIHSLGDFGVTQLLIVEQQKGLGVFGPQVSQREVNFLGQMIGRSSVGRVVGDELDHRLGDRTPPPSGHGRAAAIAGNRQEPGQEVALRIPAMQVFQDPDERFLGGIFGVLPLAQHAITQAKHGPVEPLDERKHGSLVAGKTMPHQRVQVVVAAPGHGQVTGSRK
jgi:hypothetical protein